MQHYYEDLGSDLWGEYGFMDAFHLGEDPDWYADTYLAIDQGPIIVMIENHRTGLIWEQFMANAEIEPALQSIGWTNATDAGLEVSYYEGKWNTIPAFDALTPIFDDIASIPTHSIRNRDDHYGLRFIGQITIDTTGTYTFSLTSDDGSRLSINGDVLIDNDGLHGNIEVTGTIDLDVGEHDIRVDYFEGTGGQLLELRYAGPGFEQTIVPVNVLSH